MNEYYIYQYVCKKTKQVIYVGMGKGHRAWNLKSHYNHCPALRDYDVLIEILQENLPIDYAIVGENTLLQSYTHLLNKQGARDVSKFIKDRLENTEDKV